MIVDAALARRHEEGNPIRVAMVGAGFMARGIARQIVNYVKGMELVAISNRNLSAARRAFDDAGVNEHHIVSNVADLEEAVVKGKRCVTEDASLLCRADRIDAVIEATGAVEFGATVAMLGIEHGKHVILMNAELDGTVGPILKVYADKAGVVITNADGDQPGVIMNLYRFVKGGGYTTYGLAENHDIVEGDALLPMGLAEGCRLLQDVPQDTVLTYADIEVPAGRLSDRLRREQSEHFETPPEVGG